VPLELHRVVLVEHRSEPTEPVLVVGAILGNAVDGEHRCACRLNDRVGALARARSTISG
jgi:hypothetical protein